MAIVEVQWKVVKAVFVEVVFFAVFLSFLLVQWSDFKLKHREYYPKVSKLEMSEWLKRNRGVQLLKRRSASKQCVREWAVRQSDVCVFALALRQNQEQV